MSGLISLLIGALLGMVSGLISGLVGVGGGTIIIPLLVFLLGYNQHLAQGTALLAFSLPVFWTATWTYYRQKRVDWRLALSIAVGMVGASFFAARFVQNLRSTELTRIFAIFLIATAIWQFWRAGRRLSSKTRRALPTLQKILLGMGIGAAAGILQGLTGLGGGVVIVPLLVFLAGLDQHTAQGTSLLTMSLLVSLVAAIPYWQKGNIAVEVGIALAVGITLGSTLSSRIAQRIAGPHLARLFAVVIGLMGIGLLLRG